MSRWLAHTGSPALAPDLLHRSEHSLTVQGTSSTRQSEPAHGDGFGPGWNTGSTAVLNHAS